MRSSYRPKHASLPLGAVAVSCLLGQLPTAGSLLAAVLGPWHSLSKELPPQKDAAAAKPYRQVLANYRDVQYCGNLTLGSQHIKAVLDTGSLEFVVLSDRCRKWCGREDRLYHPNASDTRREGELSKLLSYGSGRLLGQEAYENVAVGELEASIAPFWEVFDADMPVILESTFTAIVGLGPAAQDRRLLEPGSDKNDGSSALLLPKLRLDRFSVCLGRAAGSPGYATWGDDAADRAPEGVVKDLVIKDDAHWMAQLSDVRLGKARIGCEDGCAAVLDTGTSLLSAPKAAASKLVRAVGALKGGCEGIDEIPSLSFKLNGVEFSLSPDAFVARMIGEAPKRLNSRLAAPKPKKAANAAAHSACQVALMKADVASHLGPVWIFGMPWFREFHTTFVQGSQDSDPLVRVAAAGAGCRPASAASNDTDVRAGGAAMGSRVVDAAMLRAPEWLGEARLPGRWPSLGPNKQAAGVALRG